MSTPDRPALTVIVPTRNECANVRPLVDRVHQALMGIPYEIVFVDDSDDQTPETVEREIAAGRTVRLIHRAVGQRQGGLSTAVVLGIREARAQNIASLDGDLQHPPEKLRELLRRLSDAEVVVASRYTRGGSARGLGGVGRRLGSLGARFLAHTFVPRSRLSSDPLGGYFALRREVLDGVRLRPVGYKILLEVLARGRITRVVDLPYTFEARREGASKANLRQMQLYLLHLARLCRCEDRGPLAFCASLVLRLVASSLTRFPADGSRPPVGHPRMVPQVRRRRELAASERASPAAVGVQEGGWPAA